jgi:pimeloyl-ACP methyl ester carboxylesterase
MARHPGLLRAVALDSAFAARDLDPWYASSPLTASRALSAVCRRDAGCRAATAGRADGPVDRLAALVARLRSGRPLTAVVAIGGGPRVRRVVDVRALVDLVQDAGGDVAIYRELDAAVRAALAGDAVPLARLVAEGDRHNHHAVPATEDSNGLYFAVACTDYPQLFSKTATFAQRRAELRRRLLRAARSDTFAPFTAREWVSMSAYSETYGACQEWPHSAGVPAPVEAGAAPLPASVPVLLLGGDLDSITPVRDATRLARRLGRRARVVDLRNTVHATTEGDDALLAGSDCGQRLVRQFFARPQTLDRLDTSCAGRLPAVHTAAAFPRRLKDAVPAQLVAGADPGPMARRAVTVGAYALADAATRLINSELQRDVGLRGGGFSVDDGESVEHLALNDVRYVADATVSGRASYRTANGAISGDLEIRFRNGAPLRVRLRWAQTGRSARATTAAGAQLVLPAP